MSAWSHLPNAHHIDWALKSLKENPELWSAARGIAHDSARSIAHDSALRDMAFESARGVARAAAWDMVWDMAWDMARAAARDMACSTIAALVAYDDCDQYLQMTYEKLKMYAILSEKPQAVLLLPMKYVEERLNEQLKETI